MSEGYLRPAGQCRTKARTSIVQRGAAESGVIGSSNAQCGATCIGLSDALSKVLINIASSGASTG